MNLKESKDEIELSELMRTSQAGDGAAYRELLLRIEKMLAPFVRKSVPNEAAEDVLQEIILAIHTKRHTFNSEQYFLPWCYAIARYKIIDSIRARTRREVLAFDPDEIEITADTYATATFSDEQFDALMASLSEKQKQIVKLVKLDGLSIKEAAQKTGLSESDVKINIHRALKKLKSRFQGGRQ